MFGELHSILFCNNTFVVRLKLFDVYKFYWASMPTTFSNSNKILHQQVRVNDNYRFRVVVLGKYLHSYNRFTFYTRENNKNCCSDTQHKNI